MLHLLSIVLFLSYTSANLEPQVAFRCGKPSVYLSLEGGSRAGWIRDLDQGCVGRFEDVLAFCKRVYPKLASNFSGVVPSASLIQIHNWCDFEQKRCESRTHNIYLVRPFKCLTTHFVPEALLVPDTCSFGHVFSPAVKRQCRPLESWRQVAVEECRKRVNKTVLFSMGVLTPCDEDVNKIPLDQTYAGVEFVCCSESVKKMAAPHEYVVNLTEQSKNSVLATHKKDITPQADESKDDFLKARRKLEKEEEESEKQLETTFERGMARLLELQENGEAAGRLIEQLKMRFSQKFEEILSEEVAKWRNLEVQQEEKLTTSFIEKLESLRTEFMTAIRKENPKLNDLWPALRNFVSAVMQAKIQALNFFSHLIVNDPAEAGRDRQFLNERFTRLNLALEEILGELKRTPLLEGELKRKAHDLTSKYDNLDMSKNILLSASINTEKEKGKPKLLVDGEARMKEFLNNYEHAGKVRMTRRKQIVFAHDRNSMNGMKEQTSYLNPPSDHLPLKQMALQHTKAQAEPSPSLTEDLASSRVGSLIGGLVAGMALLLLVLVVVLAVRHRQERPHGGYVMSVVELSPDDEQGICPNIQNNGEERHLANMQINGYENPTYKFFEKQ